MKELDKLREMAQARCLACSFEKFWGSSEVWTRAHTCHGDLLTIQAALVAVVDEAAAAIGGHPANAIHARNEYGPCPYCRVQRLRAEIMKLTKEK